MKKFVKILAVILVAVIIIIVVAAVITGGRSRTTGYDTPVSFYDYGAGVAITLNLPASHEPKNEGENQFFARVDGLQRWHPHKQLHQELGATYNTIAEAPYHWAEKTVYVERTPGETEQAFMRRLVERAVEFYKEHCLCCPQWAAGLATHIAPEQLAAYHQANYEKIASFLIAHGLTGRDFLDYVDLIHIVATDLDVGDKSIARDIVGVTLTALERVDLDRSYFTEIGGIWWHAGIDPNWPDELMYRHLKGIIGTVETRKVLHIVSKQDGKEQFSCNIWTFHHRITSEGTLLTTFFDLIHKGGTQPVQTENPTPRPTQPPSSTSTPPPQPTPTPPPQPTPTPPPDPTPTPPPQPTPTPPPDPTPTPPPQPTKDPSQDPAQQDNAPIGGGQSEDTGPGTFQPTEPPRPPEVYVPPPVVTAAPATQAPAATQEPVATQPPPPQPTQPPAQVVQETAPPPEPIPVVQDSNGTAGEDNGAFGPPD